MVDAVCQFEEAEAALLKAEHGTGTKSILKPHDSAEIQLRAMAFRNDKTTMTMTTVRTEEVKRLLSVFWVAETSSIAAKVVDTAFNERIVPFTNLRRLMGSVAYDWIESMVISKLNVPSVHFQNGT